MTALRGKRLLITRPRAQTAALCAKLSALGATPIVFPTIEIAPLSDYSRLDDALKNLAHYHWLIFTSVNGVTAVWERLNVLSLNGLQTFTGLVAAIGPATAHALEQRGVTVTLIPDNYVAEAILAHIGDVRGQSILLPRAEIARETLATELEQRGATVHEIAAYRTLPVAPDPNALAEFQRGVDAILFTSSSTVRNFMALLQHNHVPVPAVVIACIGPITAQTARELNLSVHIIASTYTTNGLVDALLNYFAVSEHPEQSGQALSAA